MIWFLLLLAIVLGVLFGWSAFFTTLGVGVALVLAVVMLVIALVVIVGVVLAARRRNATAFYTNRW